MSLFIQWESQWNDISNRTPSIGFLNLGGWFCSAVCEHLGCVHQLRTTRWPVQIQPQSLLVDFGILVTRKEFWKKTTKKNLFWKQRFFIIFVLKKQDFQESSFFLSSFSRIVVFVVVFFQNSFLVARIPKSTKSDCGWIWTGYRVVLSWCSSSIFILI